MAVKTNKRDGVLVTGTSLTDSITNTGSKVTITALAGNDIVDNEGYDVSINTNEGNDSVYTGWGDRCTINTNEGNDYVYNGPYGDNYVINTGTGNDYVENSSSRDSTINTASGNDYVDNSLSHYCTINTGAGNDSILNYRSDLCIINAGASNDSVFNYSSTDCTINTGAGNDSVFNGYDSDNCIINTGEGNDLISLNSESYYNVIIYNSGDGNDIIHGFKENSTLSIGSGEYSSKKDGSDIIVTVGEGKITLVGAKNLSKVNIKGTKTDNSKNIFSNVNVTDLGGESKESIRNKAISGLSSLLKTDMSDVVLKNVDGLKTLDDQTRKKLSSLASIFKLANEANSSFGVLGNLCASAETFLGLVQSKKRDATWGKQVSDCVDKELAKSLGLGLGGSIFGLVGSIVATTDGITNDERDNIVKDVFSVSGEFAKLVVPATKALPMEINLVVATASALYMGSVQMQKSLEKYAADGSITLTDLRDAKIDSAMVGLDEFASKMTFGVSDIYFKWLDKKTGGNTYSNMTYIEKAAEGYKILFNYIGEQSVNLAKNIGSAIGNWWTKITSSLNQKGLNLKGFQAEPAMISFTDKTGTIHWSAVTEQTHFQAAKVPTHSQAELAMICSSTVQVRTLSPIMRRATKFLSARL